jgi:hypothetical protein
MFRLIRIFICLTVCASFVLFAYHNATSSREILFHLLKKFHPICRSVSPQYFEPCESRPYPHCQFFKRHVTHAIPWAQDLWWTKWYRDRLFSDSFGFSPVRTFPSLFHAQILFIYYRRYAVIAIDELIDCLTDWLTDRLTDWLTN